MGVLTWVIVAVVVLAVIGLGAGVFFSGLIRGAEIIGDNPAVQDATEETRDFIDDRVDTQVSTSDALIVTTNEFTYERGEPVIITVRNNGDTALQFPDSAYGLEIQNADTGERYGLAAAEVITELEPGREAKITWEQEGSVDAGDYTATVHTTPADESISAQVEFQITG
jgi:uncharacterized cupredoxin-like copper-binding protein